MPSGIWCGGAPTIVTGVPEATASIGTADPTTTAARTRGMVTGMRAALAGSRMRDFSVQLSPPKAEWVETEYD